MAMKYLAKNETVHVEYMGIRFVRVNTKGDSVPVRWFHMDQLEGRDFEVGQESAEFQILEHEWKNLENVMNLSGGAVTETKPDEEVVDG